MVFPSLSYYRWFFVIYAGVGLTALPLDLILECVNRPIRMKKNEFEAARDTIARELVELKKKGDQIRDLDAESKDSGLGCNRNNVISL